ncbi:dihydrolipoamide acetyltransferase family protein [Cryobacterium psychrophilum]|uniref:Dihydrolipoamide acetyltransferase component of pyruvate dehydrogenase complex n=1 Tax=Cryobacterium psychrophilum TaxID=41988 RepID=A0A4Y8KTQ2_9MICO|nr:dihydrolipoamide acetyltransferase family protein [Cryobacterium psychrophilum]TDW31371.1 pyruvate dehydrogenase E2 component (dihydrolipoamide acetyltransferase) [Cryobacterium psychrophilum]TFD78820.1 2-oxo acid dehydrogenase subunit E2 [Cryobacterium psychrophilum]
MPNEFLLPDLGEGLTEAEIVSWLVAPGDTIAIDQPVVEVESAKSVVELPSPFGGIVEKIFGEPGQTIHAGQVLITVADPAETDAVGTDSMPPKAAPVETTQGTMPTAAPVPPVEAAPEASADVSGAVLIGYGTTVSTRPARQPAQGRFGKASPAPAAPAPAAPAAPAAHAVQALDADRRSPVVSPLVRRLARENGFEASQLLGTGKDGLVVRADVESFLHGTREAENPRPAEAAAAPAPAASTPAPATAGTGESVRIPIVGLRKVVAQRLATSRREIPEATIWLDVDATELFVARDRLLAATGERFSVTALIARFVVAGLRQFPELNSSVDTASQEILHHGAINLGIAAQTSRGLMVPVIHGAHNLTTRQLRDAVAGLVADAADGTFAPATLSGGTFTLNNFGSLGVDGSAAIINHPEAAILGIGRMIERPWVVNHELAVRTVVELSMVFDHRVCDGGSAAGFLTFVARCIENPVSLLAEL